MSRLATAITPDRFKYALNLKRDDYRMTHFHPAAMASTVNTLAGAPVMVVIDGLAYVGKLSGTRQTPGYGTFQVLVETEHSKTWFTQDKVSVIIPLEERVHPYCREAVEKVRLAVQNGEDLFSSSVGR